LISQVPDPCEINKEYPMYDILWSDPSDTQGWCVNSARGGVSEVVQTPAWSSVALKPLVVQTPHMSHCKLFEN
jgi:hypothetical protein